MNKWKEVVDNRKYLGITKESKCVFASTES